MKTIAALLFAGAVAVAGQASANGTSMSNCADLTAPNEIAVCESVALTRLDTEAATLFEVRMMLPMLMGERGAAQDENQAFTEQLAACGADTVCLTSAYEARISTLKTTLESAMQEFCKLKGICG